MKRLLLIIIVMFSSSVLSGPKINPQFQADLPQKGMKIKHDDSGRIIELVNSAWTDRVKSENGEWVYFNYEQGYSYTKKQGFLKIYSLDGKLVEEKWSETINGGISQEEAMIAINLFKQNETVIKQFMTTDTPINIQTGFNFTDETECRKGLRCVHVFAESPETKKSVLAHSIIRLNDLSVPYPDFQKVLAQIKQSKTNKLN